MVTLKTKTNIKKLIKQPPRESWILIPLLPITNNLKIPKEIEIITYYERTSKEHRIIIQQSYTTENQNWLNKW